VQRGLEDIGGQRNLEEGWPGRELKDKLMSKTEGLFQWASAVLQALENAYNPTRTLEKLLNETKTGLAPEKKMDEIYSKILQACDWDDDDFKRDYDQIMGAVLAAKSPLLERSANRTARTHSPLVSPRLPHHSRASVPPERTIRDLREGA